MSFGIAVHETIKDILNDDLLDIKSNFQKKFKHELKRLPAQFKSQIVTDKRTKETVQDMMNKGESLCLASIKQLHIDFPGFKVISAEGKLIEPIKEYVSKLFEFKGYIDLILVTPDEQIIILDWKTTSWGWDVKKKSDKIISYQLVYYKHFISQQFGIDPEKIKTFFALIKRTAKKDNIEIFETVVGKKKIENSLKVLNGMLYNIEHKNFPKNKLG